jgi:ABC-type protease/lipase transport system fused ATPase/permease subunit
MDDIHQKIMDAVRSVIAAVGAVLVTLGIASPEDVNHWLATGMMIAGSIVSLGAAVWPIVQLVWKRK